MPALPQDDGMDENSKLVDQAVPYESGGQIGATQGDVAPGLRLQFRDLFRHDVGNHRGIPVCLREGP